MAKRIKRWRRGGRDEERYVVVLASDATGRKPKYMPRRIENVKPSDTVVAYSKPGEQVDYFVAHRQARKFNADMAWANKRYPDGIVYDD